MDISIINGSFYNNESTTTPTSNYRLVIDCLVKELDKEGKEIEVKKYFEFDNVDNYSISSSSTITTKPLVSGEVIGDHLYKNPSIISISGQFSEYGYKNQLYKNGENRLTTIQRVFEKLKEDGTLLNLTFMSNKNGDLDVKYLVRKGYVIENLNWTMGEFSMSYTMSLKEILLYSIINEPVPDPYDSSLPSIYVASKSSLKESVISSSTVGSYCIDLASQNGILTEAFNSHIADNVLNFFKFSANVGVAKVIGAIVGATTIAVPAIMSTIVAGTFTAAGALAATGAGAIVGVAIVAVVSIGVAIYKLYQESKYLVKKFKYYTQKGRWDNETNRFIDWIDETIGYMDDLESAFTIYKLDDNSLSSISNKKNIEITFEMDNNYYSLKLDQNNDTKKYNVDVEDLSNGNGSVCKNKGPIIYKSSIFDLKNEDSLYDSKNGYHLFILNTGLAEIRANDSLTYIEKEQKELEAINDLSKYVILITKGNMSSFKDTFIKCLKSHLIKD